jgi:hypothetical protein
VIGSVGARRAVALLVIGDAVLGGVFFGVLLRPTSDAGGPARAVTSTTVIAPPAQPEGLIGFAGQPDVALHDTTTTVPSASTTVLPTVPSVGPTTAPTPDPRVAEVTTTAPTTAPPTTLAPSTTAPPSTGTDG